MIYMKIHKVQQIIKKQGGNFQIVFDDGTRAFWPRENIRGMYIGATVREHKHKNGQTVAFSWSKYLRFVVPQPIHIDESMEFLAEFKPFDRVRFNNAVIGALNVSVGPLIFPDNEKFAQNIFLYGLQTQHSKSR